MCPKFLLYSGPPEETLLEDSSKKKIEILSCNGALNPFGHEEADTLILLHVAHNAHHGHSKITCPYSRH